MPTSDGATYGFKYVNGHPSNPSHGYQTVTAFGVLADVKTGYPTFWSEMTILTALRTAATSAMVAKALARSESSTMAMIGTGTQAEFQALAFRAVLGITVAADARDAARGADVITTCTADKTNATVLTADMIVPGVHINAIGGDCPGKTELDAAILVNGSVFVEFTPQTRIEGEIQQLDSDSPVTEIWEVLTGRKPGRLSADEVTVFDSVGFAIEDFSALRYLQDDVAGTDVAVDVDLIADPADPKDLFSLVASVALAGVL